MKLLKQIILQRFVFNKLWKTKPINGNIFRLKQTNILYQKFYPKNSLPKSLLKSSVFVVISLFGYKYYINKSKEKEFNQFNDNLFKYLKNNSIEFVLRKTQLFLRSDENNDQKEVPNSKRFNFIADITEKVSSALVFIDVVGRHPFFNTNISISNGSGFLIDSSGLILTNAHVVGNSSELTVKLFDGRVVRGRTEFVDYRLDLATVRIVVNESLPFIKLGDSQKARTGEWVIALGSPFSLSNTITVGVISSLNRKSRELGLNNNEIDYIQTDVIVNEGNSGGPLVNLDGEAIGINSMKVTAGISFAIPINYAKEFIERANRFQQKNTEIDSNDQKENTSKKNKFIGISMLTLTPEIIKHLKSKDQSFPKVDHGVLVWSVVMGSPAHLEGLKPGDIITEINGKKAISANQIFEAIEVNQTLILNVKQKDRDIKISIKPQSLNSDNFY